MKTSHGLEFKPIDAEEISRFTGYDKAVAQCHIANCGYIIVDTLYEQPIDNEYDLDVIYELIKEK